MRVTDPVCGMECKLEKTEEQVDYEGITYYFCTQACRRQFEADPQRYVGPTRTP